MRPFMLTVLIFMLMAGIGCAGAQKKQLPSQASYSGQSLLLQPGERSYITLKGYKGVQEREVRISDPAVIRLVGIEHGEDSSTVVLQGMGKGQAMLLLPGANRFNARVFEFKDLKRAFNVSDVANRPVRYKGKLFMLAGHARQSDANRTERVIHAKKQAQEDWVIEDTFSGHWITGIPIPIRNARILIIAQLPQGEGKDQPLYGWTHVMVGAKGVKSPLKRGQYLMSSLPGKEGEDYKITIKGKAVSLAHHTDNTWYALRGEAFGEAEVIVTRGADEITRYKVQVMPADQIQYYDLDGERGIPVYFGG